MKRRGFFASLFGFGLLPLLGVRRESTWKEFLGDIAGGKFGRESVPEPQHPHGPFADSISLPDGWHDIHAKCHCKDEPGEPMRCSIWLDPKPHTTLSGEPIA